jgi:hypothetical protein
VCEYAEGVERGNRGRARAEGPERGPCCFGVCQNYALPEQVVTFSGAEWR